MAFSLLGESNEHYWRLHELSGHASVPRGLSSSVVPDLGENLNIRSGLARFMTRPSLKAEVEDHESHKAASSFRAAQATSEVTSHIAEPTTNAAG